MRAALNNKADVATARSGRITVLDVKDLRVHYKTPRGDVIAVNGVSFKVYQGETLGLVGNISGAILASTSLEALGLGPTRIPTLGMTIFYSIRGSGILRGMWWWWGFPIVVLVIIFTGLFLIATGLDEVANPRLRGAAKG